MKTYPIAKILQLSSAVLVMISLNGCLSTSSDISSAAASGGASSASCSSSYPDKYNYSNKLSTYKNDPQCYTQWQNVESQRQAAIANCAGGDTAAATTYYTKYYPTAAQVANSYCS